MPIFRFQLVDHGELEEPARAERPKTAHFPSENVGSALTIYLSEGREPTEPLSEKENGLVRNVTELKGGKQK